MGQVARAAPDPFHHHCYLITPWEAGEATATVGVARTGLSAGASQIGLQAASSPASMSMTGIVLGERFIAVVPYMKCGLLIRAAAVAGLPRPC
jgi:hypothetical protein